VQALRNPGVNVIYAVCPHKALLWSAHGEKHPACRVGAAEGAKERAFPHFNHNPMQNRALNLLLLTGQIAQKRLTQGSAKPAPWAKSWYPFGVTNAGLVPGACTCPAEAFGKVGSNALSARWETPRRLVHRSFSEGGSFRSFSRRADTPTRK